MKYLIFIVVIALLTGCGAGPKKTTRVLPGDFDKAVLSCKENGGVAYVDVKTSPQGRTEYVTWVYTTCLNGIRFEYRLLRTFPIAPIVFGAKK